MKIKALRYFIPTQPARGAALRNMLRGMLRRAVLGVLLISLLIGAGHWAAPVARAQEPGGEIVSVVNGDAITRADFQARLKFVRWQYILELEALFEATGGMLEIAPGPALDRYYYLTNNDELADAVLAQMEEERLLWQTGESLDVIPSAEDAQAREDAFFAAWTNTPVSALASDEAAQAFIADWYVTAEAASGLTPNDIRVVFETEALRIKLFQYLADEVPTAEPAANTRHILCAFFPDTPGIVGEPSTEQRAAAEDCITEAQIRLANGESFEDVVRLLSDDAGTVARGGVIGWTLLSNVVASYAAAVEEAPLNEVVGPVETEYGFHLIEVLERRSQELTESELEQAQQGYFALWLETLSAEADIQRAEDWNAGLPVSPGLEDANPALLPALQSLSGS